MPLDRNQPGQRGERRAAVDEQRFVVADESRRDRRRLGFGLREVVFLFFK
jgi:hypothetical protein